MTAAGRPARVGRWPARLAWALWGLASAVLAVNWVQDRLLCARRAGPTWPRWAPPWSRPCWLG
jgi:hypothetical protein